MHIAPFGKRGITTACFSHELPRELFGLKQPHGLAKAIAQSYFVRGVVDTSVERSASRIELVAVAQADMRKIELGNASHFSIATHVRPNTQHFLDRTRVV